MPHQKQELLVYILIIHCSKGPIFCSCLLFFATLWESEPRPPWNLIDDEIHGEWCCTCGISAGLFCFASTNWVYRNTFHPAFGSADYILKDVSMALLFLLQQIASIQKIGQIDLLCLNWHLKFESYPMIPWFHDSNFWPESALSHLCPTCPT